MIFVVNVGKFTVDGSYGVERVLGNFSKNLLRFLFSFLLRCTHFKGDYGNYIPRPSVWVWNLSFFLVFFWGSNFRPSENSGEVGILFWWVPHLKFTIKINIQRNGWVWGLRVWANSGKCQVQKNVSMIWLENLHPRKHHGTQPRTLGKWSFFWIGRFLGSSC